MLVSVYVVCSELCVVMVFVELVVYMMVVEDDVFVVWDDVLVVVWCGFGFVGVGLGCFL